MSGIKIETLFLVSSKELFSCILFSGYSHGNISLVGIAKTGIVAVAISVIVLIRSLLNGITDIQISCFGFHHGLVTDVFLELSLLHRFLPRNVQLIETVIHVNERKN